MQLVILLWNCVLDSSFSVLFFIVTSPCVLSFCLLTVDHGCESHTGVSEWPGWTSSIPSLISPLIFSPTYPVHLLPSWAPCWCCGWPGWPCCLWTGFRAAWPSPLPGLRAWGVVFRETAETSGPISSSSWLTTRMLSWVRLAHFLVCPSWNSVDPIFFHMSSFFLIVSDISFFNSLMCPHEFLCLSVYLREDLRGLLLHIKY